VVVGVSILEHCWVFPYRNCKQRGES